MTFPTLYAPPCRVAALRAALGTAGPVVVSAPVPHDDVVVPVRGGGVVLNGNDVGASAVRAIGTAEKPIVFTSAEPSPAPGDWRGFWFPHAVHEDNQLTHVRIEYTGADCSCVLVSCDRDVTEFEGAILLNEPAPRMFLENSVITKGAMHGVVQGYDGP